jgi:hypothetical protein
MNNQDSEIKDFFKKYKREIPDNGFSEKVTENVRVDELPLWHSFIIVGSLLAGIVTLWGLGFWKALPHYFASIIQEIQNLMYQIPPQTTIICFIVCPILLFSIFLMLFWYLDRIRQW